MVHERCPSQLDAVAAGLVVGLIGIAVCLYPCLLDLVERMEIHHGLFGEGTELKLDDLAMVAGGLNEPFISPEDWSDKDTSHE